VKNLARSYDESGDQTVFSPDGRWVAYSSDRMDRTLPPSLYVEPLDGGPARRLDAPEIDAISLRWSRDGKSLLYMDRITQSAQRLPLAGGAPQILAARAYGVDDCGSGLVLSLPDRDDCRTCSRLIVQRADGDRELARSVGKIIDPRCDPSGKRVTYWLGRGPLGNLGGEFPSELWLATTEGSGARELLSDGASNLQPSFAADGESIFFSRLKGDHRNLFELSLASGRLQQITFGDGPDFGPDVVSGGRMLLYNIDTTSEQIFVYDRRGGHRRLTMGADGATYPAVSPDDQQLVAQVWRRGRSLLVAVPTRGDGQERVLAEGAYPAFTADGREVVFTRALPDERTAILAVARTGGEPRRICEVPSRVTQAHPGHDGFVYFHPDGGHVVRVPLSGGEPERAAPDGWSELWSAADGWRVAVQDLPTGERQTHLIAPGRPLEDPRAAVVESPVVGVSADGKFLFYHAGPSLRRRRLADGDDALLLDRRMERLTTVGAGAERVYAPEWVGSVRRQLITNLAGRPRL
jgi:Tol biopolymer transport system component